MSWIRISHVPLALLLVTIYPEGDCFSDGTIGSISKQNDDFDNMTAPLCKFRAHGKSRNHFDVEFHKSNPTFVKFYLKIRGTSVVESSHTDVILPHHWVWTYSTDKSSYPYLSWYIDYGLVSFHLLDARTLELHYLTLDVIPDKRTQNCRLIIGDNASMINVANALFHIVVNNTDLHPYREHFFCYLTEIPEVDKSIAYLSGLYFNFPTNVFQYSCCIFKFSYRKGKYLKPKCNEKQQIWNLCTCGSYFTGIIILAFCPIFLFQLLKTVGKDEICQPYDFDYLTDAPLTLCQDIPEEDNWIFLDGKPTLTLSDLPSRLLSGFKENHKLTYSRLSRLLCLLIIPVLLFARMLMYKDGIGSKNPITVDDLVARRTPLGFISLLAEYEHARQTFVPVLGGPLFNVSSPSEKSDVMHVVFVVIVGALPRVLEVVFIDESDIIKRQVEERKIAKSIERYWKCQTNHSMKKNHPFLPIHVVKEGRNYATLDIALSA
ncbi:uncharacterized protein LOC127874347 [Dreissena polymorpha]|uniref:uncharacterized protein LOC127874347 n=1 Tax=Dreissena polymorpha TaxID=45954 RepID=UPI0022653300|nr:uncharacterized protein LOC127874347 [Dreissena polymorpha]